MSAAATAAGYLYASGRLRGRGAREQERGSEETQRRSEGRAEAPSRERPVIRKAVRVAALPPQQEAPSGERPKPPPRVQYRVRRWRPGQAPNESRESHEHEHEHE